MSDSREKYDTVEVVAMQFVLEGSYPVSETVRLVIATVAFGTMNEYIPLSDVNVSPEIAVRVILQKRAVSLYPCHPIDAPAIAVPFVAVMRPDMMLPMLVGNRLYIMSQRNLNVCPPADIGK